MARLWQFLTDSRVLGVIGLAALAAFLLLGADTLQLAAIWAGVAALALLAGWGIFWGARYHYRKRSATLLGETVAPASEEAAARASGSEVAVLRKSMLQAITTIKTSKLGLNSGAAALYELPWYMIIGNPAAGKSSAVGHSGLQFPIAGSKAVQGVAGTRNCDWFFTTDGILLDTAGRYSTVDADRAEWFSFLALLRKYRRRAPINGIMICVSVAELMGADPKKSIDLAKSLRTARAGTDRAAGRVRAGVRDLHQGRPDRRLRRLLPRYRARRTRPGVGRHHAATTGAAPARTCWAFFDQHFDELHDGLKEMSLASMARQPQRQDAPGRVHLPARIRVDQDAAARLPRHPVRGKHLPVQAGVPRLLLHQRAAGRQRREPVVEARGQPLRPRRCSEQNARRGGASRAATSCSTCSAR